MAADSIDSRTSTTISANTPPISDSFPLLRTLANSPDAFLYPDTFENLRSSSLAAAKLFLDPIAKQLVNTAGKKRKGSDLLLDQIHVDGFGVEEIWHQVSGVVAAVEGGVEKRRKLSQELVVRNGNGIKARDSSDSESGSGSDESEDDEGFSQDEEGSSDLEGMSDYDSGEETAKPNDQDEDMELGSSDEEDAGLEVVEDEEDEEEEDAEEDEDGKEEEGASKSYVKDVHGLNDGFFSIDDFNKITERFEMLDQGLVDEDDEDESSDIDFTVDAKNAVTKRKKKDAEDDEDMDDSEEDDFEDENLDDEPEDIMYDDFFLPPPRVQSSKKQKKGEFPSRADHEQTYEDIEADMGRVQRDLFEESDEEEVDEKERKSLHEKQTAALASEIRRLEMENVEKKKWTLAGEVKANARPMNALLEEDLDFERVSAPVPVITSEVTDSLEEMIKKRIIEGRFDDLPRRIPGMESTSRRGLIEIDDQKSKVGLADVYENEMTGADKAALSEKQKAEHAEISNMFRDVMHKLDSLSSWHFTPKPPSSEIQVVGDVAAVTMEDVRPTIAGEVNSASMLAPGEVYNPREQKRAEELVTKGGTVIRKEELSTEDKKRARRHEKEKSRKKKAEEGKTHGVASKKEERSKKGVVDTLKRGGVKVIGKGGETRNLDGKIVESKQGKSGAGAFKL